MRKLVPKQYEGEVRRRTGWVRTFGSSFPRSHRFFVVAFLISGLPGKSVFRCCAGALAAFDRPPQIFRARNRATQRTVPMNKTHPHRICLVFVASALLLVGCAAPPQPPPDPPDRPALPRQTLSLPADLPPDADRSDVARQLALLARGLYLTRAGEVRALPARYGRASWSGGAKEAPTERADRQTDERIRIPLEDRQTE